MATTKNTVAAKEVKETKDTKTTKTVAKATASKAASEKSTKTKEEAKTPAKKAAVKKTTKTASPKVEVFVEYGSAQVSISKVIEDAKLSSDKNAKDFKVYLKPEESKAYIVADGKESEMDVFFC